MPVSVEHEAIIKIIHDCPSLAPDLLRFVGIEPPDYQEVACQPGDFTQLVSAAYPS